MSSLGGIQVWHPVSRETEDGRSSAERRRSVPSWARRPEPARPDGRAGLRRRRTSQCVIDSCVYKTTYLLPPSYLLTLNTILTHRACASILTYLLVPWYGHVLESGRKRTNQNSASASETIRSAGTACAARCGQAHSGCSSSLAHLPCSCAHQRQAEPLLCTCHHLPAACCLDRDSGTLPLRAAGHRLSSFAQSLAPCLRRFPAKMQWCPRHRTLLCLRTESASCLHSMRWASTPHPR